MYLYIYGWMGVQICLEGNFHWDQLGSFKTGQDFTISVFDMGVVTHSLFVSIGTAINTWSS